MRKPQFNSRFLDEDFSKINTILTELENATKGKLDSMKPEQRQRFGKVGNAVLEWVMRVFGYMQQRPDFVPMFIDKDAFAERVALQQKVRPIVNRMRAMLDAWEDTEMLINFDLDADARDVYQNIKTLASKNIPSAQTIYDDLASRYASSGRKEVAEVAKDATKS